MVGDPGGQEVHELIPSNPSISERQAWLAILSRVQLLEARYTALEAKKKGVGLSQPVAFHPFDFARFDMATDITLTLGDLGKDLYINCTTAGKAITLPMFAENQWVNLRNNGTQNFAVKDASGSTITASLAPGTPQAFRAGIDSSGNVMQPPGSAGIPI